MRITQPLLRSQTRVHDSVPPFNRAVSRSRPSPGHANHARLRRFGVNQRTKSCHAGNQVRRGVQASYARRRDSRRRWSRDVGVKSPTQREDRGAVHRAVSSCGGPRRASRVPRRTRWNDLRRPSWETRQTTRFASVQAVCSCSARGRRQAGSLVDR